jgi:hypothetical protein
MDLNLEQAEWNVISTRVGHLVHYKNDMRNNIGKIEFI